MLPDVPFDVLPQERERVASKLRSANEFGSECGATVMDRSLDWANDILRDASIPMNVIGNAWRIRQLQYHSAALDDMTLPIGRLRVDAA